MRSYIRYPSKMPVAVLLEEVVTSEKIYLNNISRGGLSFNSMIELEKEAIIRMRMPPNRPVFEVLGNRMVRKNGAPIRNRGAVHKSG